MDIKEFQGINAIYLDESNYNKKETNLTIRKGSWSCEEDSILINYISMHGEGHWNQLACNSGLKRSGKSCRMRWKNYLHPNVRRGNFTTHEQLRIIDLHTSFGNRWSKIAEFLPGRTDNEIKNYWRTRVQKQAKQLNYDINSKEFRDFTRNIWLPRLSEQIYASKYSNNDLEDVTTDFNGVKTTMPEMDGHLSATNDNLLSGMDFQHDSNLVGNSFQKIDDPTFFGTSGELSDMLLSYDCFSTYP